MLENARKTSLAMGIALLALPVALAHADPRDDWAFLAQVRQATAAYRNINVAAQAGYVARDPFCVSGPDRGAMGVHVANPTLIGGNQPQVSEPQIVIYEPQADGSMVLVGVEYVVMADAWDAQYPNGPGPSVGGQLMLKFPAPNLFDMPSIYVLHAWAWRNNPDGNFAMWNRNVTCQKQPLPALS
ncbi:MAG: hypothetical protein JSS21_03700 [Proteobacteria bacterium]|nr:hypothetical protein [Pseudomonadota bacterium]